MLFHVHIYRHRTPLEKEADESRLAAIEQQLAQLISQGATIMLDLTKLQAELTRETDAEVAVEKLLTDLTAAIKAIPPSTDPATQAALDDLTAKFAANTDGLVAATVANTPAASPAA